MRNFTVADLLYERADASSEASSRVALKFQDRSLTYAELDARASELAAGLRRAGFRKGERVATLLYNCVEWVELFFAIAKLGGTLVPINYYIASPELAFILEDAEATWLVSEAALWPIVDGAAELGPPRRNVSIGERQADALFYDDLFRGDRLDLSDAAEEDLFLLQYTSGTTGRPKGAMHTHSTVLWNSYHQLPDFGIGSDSVVLGIPALCWAAGLHDFALAVLIAGGTFVLNPSTSFDPDEFGRTMERERVSHVLLVPTVLRRVVASGVLDRHDLSSLRVVISGGEPVPVDTMAAFHEQLPSTQVIQVFGMSEFPTIMLWLDPRYAEAKRGSTGKACSIATVRVVDEDGRETPAGEVGEIVCRSPACALGYYGKPEASEALWKGGWMHSGDLAYRDEDGFIFIAGRSKDMFISGGLNVYPAEVERVLAELPGVVEAAVVGVPDDDWGEVGEAFVVVDADDPVSPEALASGARERLAPFKVPKLWTLQTDPLPRTVSGKLTKKDLREGSRAGRDVSTTS